MYLNMVASFKKGYIVKPAKEFHYTNIKLRSRNKTLVPYPSLFVKTLVLNSNVWWFEKWNNLFCRRSNRCRTLGTNLGWSSNLLCASSPSNVMVQGAGGGTGHVKSVLFWFILSLFEENAGQMLTYFFLNLGQRKSNFRVYTVTYAFNIIDVLVDM